MGVGTTGLGDSDRHIGTSLDIFMESVTATAGADDEDSSWCFLVRRCRFPEGADDWPADCAGREEGSPKK